MSDSEIPPVDDYKEDTTSDFMLNEEDDFKLQTTTTLDDLDGSELFTDVKEFDEKPIAEASVEPKPEEPEMKAVEIEDAKVEEPAPVLFDEPVKKETAPALFDEPVKKETAPALFDEPVKEEPVPVKAQKPMVPEPTPEPIAVDEVQIVPKPRAAPVKETDEVYDIIITVSDPHKVGEGVMNSFMAYMVRTKTSLSQFKANETKVDRRFSDFLGLHEKLLAKHRHVGQIVPPAPEKSVVGMTLVKMSKSEEEAASIDFVEKRRAALERYLNRLVRHAPLVHDQNLIDFLEQPTLPQATNTRALSGAGVMRFVKNVEGQFNKMTIKMVEEDAWFEEKQQQVDSLETQLKKLHHAFESLVHHRKDLANNTAHFAKSAASLGNAEEHTSLSRALAQLSDSFEKLENQHELQSDKDFYQASEIVGDYLRIIEELKQVFMVRVKSWQMWKQAEQAVQRKREQEMKAQASGRNDKIQQIKAEIDELTERVDLAKKDFEKLSANIRKEVGQFEKDRVVDFQKMVVVFLKNMMRAQEQSIKNWEAFLPEARAIA